MWVKVQWNKGSYSIPFCFRSNRWTMVFLSLGKESCADHVALEAKWQDCGCWLIWWWLKFGMIDCYVIEGIFGYTFSLCFCFLTSDGSCKREFLLWLMTSKLNCDNVTLHNGFYTHSELNVSFFVKRLSNWNGCSQNVLIRFSSWWQTEMPRPCSSKKRQTNLGSLTYVIPQFSVSWFSLVSKVPIPFA